MVNLLHVRSSDSRYSRRPEHRRACHGGFEGAESLEISTRPRATVTSDLQGLCEYVPR